jgi:hypothetical protein
MESSSAEPECRPVSKATAKVVAPDAVYRARREANIGGLREKARRSVDARKERPPEAM